MDECPDGFTPCSGRCVDITSDPDHCGTCGRTCPTGICEESTCRETLPGHAVLLGHNFQRFRRPQILLVGNPVFLWVPRNPVRVAALTAWAPTGSGTPANNVDLAISQASLERGRTWERTPVSDPAGVADAVAAADVLLVYEQSLADDAQLRAAGTTLAPVLSAFLRRGGVVVVTDFAGGNEGTWQLLDAAGIVAAAGATEITGSRVEVLAPGDAVASGVPLSYVAERGTVRFASGEATQVVGDRVGPVVIHKVFMP
jgi:hypothetical protein